MHGGGVGRGRSVGVDTRRVEAGWVGRDGAGVAVGDETGVDFGAVPVGWRLKLAQPVNNTTMTREAEGRRALDKETPPPAEACRTTGAPVGLSVCRPDPGVKNLSRLEGWIDLFCILAAIIFCRSGSFKRRQARQTQDGTVGFGLPGGVQSGSNPPQ
ncbi:MAG: hypothetical protein A2Z37_09835 [Chloroflexi bacterium RBG_19FT_COMBO_62_14]|nr:MAG: hypothetical protein A2Z37_09835 [Chloroflexi bacterium RBG_19FT_COMBO_62_14]